MYRLATKCTTKNELARATNLSPTTHLHTVMAFVALRVGSMTQCRSVRPPTPVPSTARAERCADCEFADADPQ